VTLPQTRTLPLFGALLIAIGLVLSGCDPRFVRSSDLSPQEVQTLSGVWTGEASLSNPFVSQKTEDPCPRVFLWSMTVGKGNIDGEAVNKDTPKAPPARFNTFLDYDGSVHTVVRLNGQDTDLLGSFQRNSFSGQAKNACGSYVVRLSRRSAS
jgi:hypothetical protein